MRESVNKYMPGFSPLTRKILRDLFSLKAQVAAILVVCAFGIIMFSGPLIAIRNLRVSIADIYKKSNYEDFSVRVQRAPCQVLESLEKIPNVKAVEGRLSRETLATVRNKTLNLRVISIPSGRNYRVNSLNAEWERIAEIKNYVCFAEHHLTSEFKIRKGEKIWLKTNGSFHPLLISASVVSPEYLRLTSSAAEYVADPSQFGVIFVPYQTMLELFQIPENKPEYNEFLFKVSDPARISSTMRNVSKALGTYRILSLTKGMEEPGASVLDMEISDIEKIALFFSVLLLIVSALAIYITMTQVVFSQQRSIGVMRAIGYGSNKILSHYLGYGFFLGIAGSAVGLVGGYYSSILDVRLYAGIFDLPMVKEQMHVIIAIAGVLVGILFAVLGALIPALHAVKMRPADAIRIESGVSLSPVKKRKKAGLEILPVYLRVSLRNITRNRRRTIFTWLGVVATVALLVTATSGKDSMDWMIKKQLEKVSKWDVACAFSEPVSPGVLVQVKKMRGVIKAEPALGAPAVISSGKRHINAQVQAFVRDTTLHGYFPVRGSKSRPGPLQIVLNRGMGRKLRVKVGDTVNVSTNIGSFDFEVCGFLSEPFGGVCYINYEFVRLIFGSETFNIIVVKTKPHMAESVASYLRGLTGVSRVVTKSGILRVFEDAVSAVKTLFFIFYIMAFAMGFAILFSMITVNLLERSREIATIRTLGTSNTRIFGFVTVETLVVVFAALPFGIILGRLLELYLIEKVVLSERLAPDAIMRTLTVLGLVGASIIVTIVSELPALRRLTRLDLAKATKERAD